MTATPSETHEAALSDEQVQGIIDGCEGVTPGPWKHHRWESRVIGFYGSVNARLVARAPEVLPKLTDWGKDAAHIARLDPGTVRAFATELLARRNQPSAGEVVAGQHKWIKSTLGHGETMCEYCLITNREAAVLGELNTCSKAPTSPNQPSAGEVVAWRFKVDDPNYDDVWQYQATEEIARLRANGATVEPLYATPPDQSRVESLEAALRKLRSYNVDIAAERINYRPHDHIAVIDQALSEKPNG